MKYNLKKINIANFFYIILCIIIIVLFITHIYFQIKYMLFPYQYEKREGAALSVTYLFMNNENPYSEKNQPAYTYVYGFLFPLLNIPINLIFGINIVNFRLLSYFFVLLSCALLFYFLFKIKKYKFLISISGIFILHYLLIYGLANNAKPESLGVLLLMLSTFIPYKFQFNNKSLIISIFISILAFFCKPYYLIGALLITTYLFFFVNKKKSTLFFLLFIFLFFLSLYLINFIFSYYLNNNFFHHLNVASYSKKHMINQLINFIMKKYIKILLFVIIIFFIIKIWNKKINHNSIKFSLNKINTPLIIIEHDLFFLYNCFFIILLFIIKIGGHAGSIKAHYLYHLLSPFLVVVFCQAFNWLLLYKEKLGKILFITFYFYLLISYKPKNYHMEMYYKEWKTIEDTILKYNNVLSPPIVNSIMISNNRRIYNSGQSEYFITGINKFSKNFGFSKNINQIMDNYYNEINNSVKNKKFDLIIDKTYIDKKIFEENYYYYKTLKASVNNKNYELDLYLPKNE